MDLETMYVKKIGVTSRVGYFRKTFYPVKARTCKNCQFRTRKITYNKNDNTLNGIYSCYFFKTYKEKPLGICIPVRGSGSMAELHSDNVGIWIEKI
jgi:hypothetical protein